MKQIIGWVLLTIGLIIIFWGLYSSYQIFTAEVEPPEVFKLAQGKTGFLLGDENLSSQEAIGKIMGEQLKEVLPIDSIFKLFNLTAWSIFAMILFFGGAQIAGLGIKLIKQV